VLVALRRLAQEHESESRYASQPALDSPRPVSP
jgi:hypothetical protein